jgi:cysteine desulfurase
MEKVYLDNAATTPMDTRVIDFMYKSMQENFGNPSSTHQFGRTAKSLIETARKNISKQFNVSSSEIIFTAGGTEANNLILFNAVNNLKVTRIITSKIEHHAVLHVAEQLQKTKDISIDFINVDEFGVIDFTHLEKLLSEEKEKTLVSLMHINNEIGNILDLKKVSDLCIKYNALFHSDTVQTIGHYPLDLQEIPIDFITASAHKFHGPKGVGFAFFKKGFGILPLFFGGNQEKGARSSTENVHAILAMDKAISYCYTELEKDRKQIEELKQYFISQLKEISPEIEFNGLSNNLEKSSFTILNTRFPTSNAFLLFMLDLAGIAVSGGSACQSGSNSGSHVLQEVLNDNESNKTSVRFSFSKFTTKEELDFTLLKLKEQF